MAHPGLDSCAEILLAATSMSSMVMSVDHPGLTFNLTLVRSEPTYNQPVQQWTFTSDFAVSAHWAAPCILPRSSDCVLLSFFSINPPPLTLAGEGLLWNLHSETDSLHHSTEHGVHRSTCVQSSGASHLRLGHQVSASTLLLFAFTGAVGFSFVICKLFLFSL